jgi:hypothetical protein
VDDVEVVHADQPAAPGIEEDELAEGERLQRGDEAGAGPAGRFRNAPHLAVVPRVELDEAVLLAHGAAAHHHSRVRESVMLRT